MIGTVSVVVVVGGSVSVVVVVGGSVSVVVVVGGSVSVVVVVGGSVVVVVGASVVVVGGGGFGFVVVVVGGTVVVVVVGNGRGSGNRVMGPTGDDVVVVVLTAGLVETTVVCVPDLPGLLGEEPPEWATVVVVADFEGLVKMMILGTAVVGAAPVVVVTAVEGVVVCVPWLAGFVVGGCVPTVGDTGAAARDG
jgi:hypothetical protein